MTKPRGEVLIAIMNNPLDMAIAYDRNWYRIPVSSAKKWLKDRWPPEWLAFYQTKIFGAEAYAVRYYAQVIDIQKVYRYQLFPDEPEDYKTYRQYYKLVLSPLKQLPQPIFSRRWRRIIFIPTTWEKLINAVEINDLYDGSPLEDRLWADFKRLKIYAERQTLVTVKDKNYFLDFAIYCALGDLDVETDGDTWHSDIERIHLDNIRDNDLETVGWRILRFNTHHIHEELEEYCVPTITENINRLGGIEEGKILPRKIDPDAPVGLQQMTLFNGLEDDHTTNENLLYDRYLAKLEIMSPDEKDGRMKEPTFKRKTVTREDIIKALHDFDDTYPDTGDFDNWLEKKNYKYAVLYNGKLYPPKHILSQARQINVRKFSGGEMTNRVFRQLDFEIIDKP